VNYEICPPKHIREKVPALTDELPGRFLMALRKRATPIPGVPRLSVYERDPKDEPYINLAIAAGADYVASRDADILFENHRRE
jgi:predicted nucleic acid-binding protein